MLQRKPQEVGRHIGKAASYAAQQAAADSQDASQQQLVLLLLWLKLLLLAPQLTSASLQHSAADTIGTPCQIHVRRCALDMPQTSAMHLWLLLDTHSHVSELLT
jgi:hypothetical protein